MCVCAYVRICIFGYVCVYRLWGGTLGNKIMCKQGLCGVGKGATIVCGRAHALASTAQTPPGNAPNYFITSWLHLKRLWIFSPACSKHIRFKHALCRVTLLKNGNNNQTKRCGFLSHVLTWWQFWPGRWRGGERMIRLLSLLVSRVAFVERFTPLCWALWEGLLAVSAKVWMQDWWFKISDLSVIGQLCPVLFLKELL